MQHLPLTPCEIIGVSVLGGVEGKEVIEVEVKLPEGRKLLALSRHNAAKLLTELDGLPIWSS